MKVLIGGDAKAMTRLGNHAATRTTEHDGQQERINTCPALRAGRQEAFAPAGAPEDQSAAQERDRALAAWAHEHGVVQNKGESRSSFRVRVMTEMALQTKAEAA